MKHILLKCKKTYIHATKYIDDTREDMFVDLVSCISFVSHIGSCRTYCSDIHQTRWISFVSQIGSCRTYCGDIHETRWISFVSHIGSCRTCCSDIHQTLWYEHIWNLTCTHTKRPTFMKRDIHETRPMYMKQL